MNSLSKKEAKIVIAINGKTNNNGGLFGRENQHILRVTGIIALKTGWKTSVKIFRRDKNWQAAKSSSGFSCHMIKTFDDCEDKYTGQALKKVFAFVNEEMINSSDSISRPQTDPGDAVILSPENVVSHPVTAADQMDITQGFVCVCVVITLGM